MTPPARTLFESPLHALAIVACACALSACGGGGSTGEVLGAGADDARSSADLATATTTLALDAPSFAEADVPPLATPSFHVAPVLLEVPDDDDAIDGLASAQRGPHLQAVTGALAHVSTKRLTLQALRSAEGAVGGAPEAATPFAATAVATYTPAQIRAAYGMPALPAAGTTPTPAQAAQMGAGQTIYIVDARHDPAVAAELAAFNAKFGLPGCTTKAIAPTAALPIAAPSAAACELTVVYSTPSGTMTSVAPAYEAGWATEIALDVQWAHATAPFARIVLIEAPDATLNSLLAAVRLANAMGPGTVSMSFGAAEGTYTASVDGAFAGAGMSYFAATGDSGAGVSWPSVSPSVVAVGGTRLAWNGAGSRSESAWSGTGGGTSLYTATPAYQSLAVPGLGSVAHRTVADVAFNADPSTGQYVAVIAPGSTTASWLSAGGTSLSTPQWAGIAAVANAVRRQSAKPMLGAPHPLLYAGIASVPGTYAAAFADVTAGSDGSCVTCSARVGYDAVTGLGTPNASSLIAALSGATAPPQAPVVTGAAIAGKVGTALTFTVSATAPNPVNFTLSGAPSGFVIGSTGAVSWPVPVAGTYAVTVTARDTKTGLSGQGVYSIAVSAPPPPVAPTVAAAAIAGRPGVALAFSLAVSAANPVVYGLSGAPKGMTISGTGVVSWPSPVLGTYGVTVTAKDSKTGLVGQGLATVRIAAAGPVITAQPITGVAGRAVSGTIGIADPGATSLSVSIAGAPMGMSFSVNGMTFTASWPVPVVGNYALTIAVRDSAGLTATATVPISIAAK